MMVVHELGHVLAAWASGGTVAKVVLHPLEFARTDIADNPHPLLVAWGGASGGTLLPLCFLWIAKWKRLPTFYIFQFFAGFCLVVHGIYLGAVSFMNAADAGDLMRHGTPRIGAFRNRDRAFGLLPLEWIGTALWPWASRRTSGPPGRDRDVHAPGCRNCHRGCCRQPIVVRQICWQLSAKPEA